MLETDKNITLTNAGAWVSSWAAEIISEAEKNGLVPNNLLGSDLTVGMTLCRRSRQPLRSSERNRNS